MEEPVTRSTAVVNVALVTVITVGHRDRSVRGSSGKSTIANTVCQGDILHDSVDFYDSRFRILL